MWSRSALLAVVICLATETALGLKHEMSVQEDDRYHIELEQFGFAKDGHLRLLFSGLQTFDSNGEAISESSYSVGLLGAVKYRALDKSRDLVDPTVAAHATSPKCDLFSAPVSEPLPNQPGFYPIPPSSGTVKNFAIVFNGNTSYDITIPITEGNEGLYDLYVINCGQHPGLETSKRFSLSFSLNIEQNNVDAEGRKNYLAVGEFPLPTIYGIIGAIYVLAAGYWIYRYMRPQNGARAVHRIHYVMTAMILIKPLSVIWQAIEYFRIQETGSPEGWNVVYYLFSFLRGISTVVVILMIGTGWSFMKPYFSTNDKRVFIAVIPLQLVANIALVVIEENMRGFAGWAQWETIFRLVDLVCYGVLLLPVLWSLRRLKDGALADGKARQTLIKLQLFRRFYLSLVAYIYFTRVMVNFIDYTLPYFLTWLAPTLTEAATFSFFLFTGHQFRPVPNNPYFAQSQEEEDRAKEQVMSLQREMEDVM